MDELTLILKEILVEIRALNKKTDAVISELGELKTKGDCISGQLSNLQEAVSDVEYAVCDVEDAVCDVEDAVSDVEDVVKTFGH